MSETNGHLAAALSYLDTHTPDFLATLKDLSRIPGVSADGYPKDALERSAEAVADALRAAAVENVQVLSISGVHPYVYGDWLHKPGAPTILLYGHHDVQPEGRHERWKSPPFEPTERNGRLYGRGTADDKAGVMAHVAAVASYLKSSGNLPCNVKFIIEGEEEIGSENLGRFLEKYKGMMAADFIVLSDTANFDTGIPALTYQLRGICQVDVEVQSLDQPKHSGMFGGPVPDPVQVLCRIIADLTGKNGELNVPGLYRKVARPGAQQLARIRKLPFNEAKFKREAGMMKGMTLAGEKGFSVYEKLWTRPSLTVIAFEARAIQGSSNQIIDAARARLSLRTVPNMEAREAGRLLVKKLTTKPPYGAKVTAKVNGGTPWWTTDPEGPAFEAARRALKAGFKKETAMIGAGGSIGFVGPFATLLGGAPCLLMGVEDPACNAHSENESLHLGDWVKCMRSAVYLYDELSRVPVKERGVRLALVALLSLALASPAWAEDPEEKGARRLAACHEVLVEALGMPESIPRDLLDRAECVIVIPSVKKAALVVGARWGRGAASCRKRDGRSGWSAPLMMSVGGGSFGFQVGGQAADYVLLVMNPRGMESLLKSKFTLGADASVAGGPKGRTASAATDAWMRAEILSYTRSRGLFAGVSIEGTVINRDDDTNEAVYGEPVGARRVLLEERYEVPASARAFIDALNEYSGVRHPDR